MKKTKRGAIISILIFLLLCAGGIYMAMYGVGENKTGKAVDIPLGLDLQGGLSVTYEITTQNPTDDEIAATIDKLQRRVDEYSSEGEVYQTGDDRISVEIPVDTTKVDAHAILEELGQPGQLLFLDGDNYLKWSNGEDYEAALTGSDIKSAEGGIIQTNNGTSKEYVVSVVFTDEGAQKFANVTAANINYVIYIIYDNEVVSAPTVQETITGGSAQINGMDSLDEAKMLASTIQIGALPLELSQLQYNIVGAKLGQDAVSTSLKAGVIGFAIVCLIMLVVYLLPGFISILALVAYVILLLLILSIQEVTLTLPGIAGILLSVGMAVDANVIIFTRIKEELAGGNSVVTAVQSGFHKALSAILDGNITTLIATIVLMTVGTGSIKGFANTLMIGIILSMFTALVVTKILLNAFVSLGATNPKLYGKAKAPKICNYVKASKVCFVISAVAIVAGLVFMPINKSNTGKSLNYSLEFTGGTSTTVEFAEAYTLDRAEAEIIPVISAATGVSTGEIQVQTVEGTNQIIFKTPQLPEEVSNALEQSLVASFTGSSIVSVDTISSTISGEMKKDAVIAIVLASILMLIYIAIRFSDVKFGASAVIALIHDVMIVFAIYSIAQLSVGNTFIACMLTIVGYSINATIIIFDRIRENMKLMDKKTELSSVVNESIAQTFTRTIFTSLTTFVMVLVLFIMGVASLKEFTLTLMAGIVIGAYSSVCITGPMWLLMKKAGKKQAE